MSAAAALCFSGDSGLVRVPINVNSVQFQVLFLLLLDLDSGRSIQLPVRFIQNQRQWC
ncbi:hypothetical protein Hanom_Chr09g00813831 [Helianthus anomalus]